jgi:hypothetical protein
VSRQPVAKTKSGPAYFTFDADEWDRIMAQLSRPLFGVLAAPVTPQEERAKRRSGFVEPILARKGLSVHLFSQNCGLDKNSVRKYLNGTTKKPRKALLAGMAKELGVEPSKMPQ